MNPREKGNEFKSKPCQETKQQMPHFTRSIYCLSANHTRESLIIRLFQTKRLQISYLRYWRIALDSEVWMQRNRTDKTLPNTGFQCVMSYHGIFFFFEEAYHGILFYSIRQLCFREQDTPTHITTFFTQQKLFLLCFPCFRGISYGCWEKEIYSSFGTR